MRLKTISAPTIPEAMKEVRQTWGEDAVIVSSLRLADGRTQLVVAIGENENDTMLSQTLLQSSKGHIQNDNAEKMRALLSMHRVPDLLIAKMLKATDLSGDFAQILTDTLRHVFSFSPIGIVKTKRAFLLTGMSACGKTTSLIKWALMAKQQHVKVALVSIDNHKAGAIQGLQSVANLLKVPLTIVEDLEQLNKAVQEARSDSDLILIDSAGLNPWMATDMSFLAEVKQQCIGVEPIVVIPAGLDSLETGDIASQFVRLGCTRFIATRLDISSVYGNILSAAASGLALTYYGKGAMPTDLFSSFSAETLSDLLMNTPLSRELLS
ncbi:MAG: hypothetical protein IKV03_03690 [Alphaproteobacteria bacterium]|nr:hypothetical protein [Alphaproteobacteria bacterium]